MINSVCVQNHLIYLRPSLLNYATNKQHKSLFQLLHSSPRLFWFYRPRRLWKTTGRRQTGHCTAESGSATTRHDIEPDYLWCCGTSTVRSVAKKRCCSNVHYHKGAQHPRSNTPADIMLKMLCQFDCFAPGVSD